MRKRPAPPASGDGHGRGREPERSRGGRDRGDRAGSPGARRRRRRGRRARARVRGARGDARTQARPPRDRRGHGRPLLPDRRTGRAGGGDAAGARRRRPLPAGRRRRLANAARARAAAPARLRARRGDGGTGGGAVVRARRPPSLLESFNYAFEGIIHVLRTQRNLRIHFAVAALVLVAALVSGVDKLELIALLLAIAFVLIAEMLNTAVEAAVDVATTSFDPMAKLAKDIAAGAVLIATAVAVAVGYLVFSGQVAERSSKLLDRLTNVPAELTLIALVLTTILVVATKALTGRGSPLRGGLPSGHAAVAFAGWMAATLILDDSRHHFLISSLTFIMAMLVAQTRVESGVHSSVEVAYGGLLGALVTLAVFQVAQ